MHGNEVQITLCKNIIIVLHNKIVTQGQQLKQTTKLWKLSKTLGGDIFTRVVNGRGNFTSGLSYWERSEMYAPKNWWANMDNAYNFEFQVNQFDLKPLKSRKKA